MRESWRVVPRSSVSQLSIYEASVEAIPLIGIAVTTLSDGIILQGLRLQRRYGFLTNDSLLVATTLQVGAPLLASADRRLAIAREVEIAVPEDLT